MSHVLERDGLAACPDDPARTAAPAGMTAAQETQLAEWAAAYAWMVRENVKETLRGRTRSTAVMYGGMLHHSPAKDIAEVLQDSMSYDDIAILIAATYDPASQDKGRALVSKLIDGLAERTGVRLAEVKANNEGLGS